MPSSYAQTSFSNGYEFTQGSGYALPEYPFVAPPELGSTQPTRHAAPGSWAGARSPVIGGTRRARPKTPPF